MTMGAFLNPSFVAAALASLGALAWKSTVILALAFALSTLLARRSAALRHGVWTLAVGALLALPLAKLVAPPLATPLPFGGPAMEARVAPSPNRVARPAKPAGEAAAPVAVPARTTASVKTPVAPDWHLLAFMTWLFGAAAVLLFFAAGRIALARLARQSRPFTEPTWLAAAAEVAAHLGVRQPPRFLVADAASSPMTWGVLKPTILLPASAADWSEAQRRSFLVHELAHVARRDCAIQEAAHIACALYWFHPGVWFAAHRLRVEREPACDDLVLADGASAEAYARQLLDVVRAGRVPRAALSLSGAAMASPSQLETRVRALLDGARDRGAIGRVRALLAGVAALALLLPLAAIVPATSRASSRLDVKGDLSGNALETRWQRALKEGPTGKRNGAFWFAYAIPYDGGKEGKETLLSDSEGWNEKDLEPHGVRLADRLGCDERDAVILLHVPAGGDRGAIPGFDRVALRTARLSPDLRGQPVIAVGTVGLEESLDWVSARFLETPDDRRAAVLVTAFSLHGVPRTEPLLEEILESDRADEVRVQAAEGLDRHPGANALKALVMHARNDASEEVQRECAEGVGDLDYPPATDALIALVRDLDNEQVRNEAVESLGEREPERVLPVLLSVADKDPSEMVRREATETLGDLRDNAGLKALRNMAQHHRDPGVRSEAIETLNEMGLRAEQAAAGR
jgi:beta-lactamase regulating signal transducer with metallopeptidase domain